MAFVDNGQTLVVHDSDAISFWSIPNQIEVMRWPLKDASDFAVSPDQSIIAVQRREHIQFLRGVP